MIILMMNVSNIYSCENCKYNAGDDDFIELAM